MEAAKKRNTGAGVTAAGSEKRSKRGHGSTALFVAMDYAFLLTFARFLSYLITSQLLPSVASSSAA